LRENHELAMSLLDEARIAARIRHPNVVPVYDVGEDPAGLFLVMEYVEGNTLSGLQNAARVVGDVIPIPVGLRILTDALAGLQSAHELVDADGTPLEIVHRDFSPQNILVGTDGISRLTDFGIAKAAGRSGHTSPGAIKGKVGYMAPEQARGKGLDQRCDVWAAGVIAWELLAGRPLHGSDDEVATLLDVVTRTPPDLRTVDRTIPEALALAVASALNPDRQLRCPTANELRQRLIDGWRPLGPLADPMQVAAYLASVGGGRTLTPLPRETKVVPTPADQAAGDQPFFKARLAPGPRETLTLQSLAAEDRAPSVAPPAVPARPGRQLAALLTLGLTVAIGAFAVHHARRPRAAVAAALPSPGGASRLERVALGPEPPRPPPSAGQENLAVTVTRTPKAAPLTDMVEPVAVEPIAHLARIGSRSAMRTSHAVRRQRAHAAHHATRGPAPAVSPARPAAMVPAASPAPPPLAGNPYAGVRP
jgi:serine/threonine-protein kinase